MSSKKVTKIDVVQIAEKRDSALAKANSYFIKMRKLEKDAEKLDLIISDNCTHPTKYLKLKNFSGMNSFWLCQICFQTIDPNQDKKNKRNEESIEGLFDEIWEDLPVEWSKI